ncbi:MAG: tannase/feruloyl esterase family alpha/beta hydrolase, partial [Acidobacteria bacterium]
MRALPAISIAVTIAIWNPTPVLAATCESLSSLALPAATITLAQEVAAGSFEPPASGRGGRGAPPSNVLKSLPAFCRLAATLKPTSDSEIKIEVWLPSSGWNGKFQAVGNGGWTGSIAYPAMIEALRRGYATSSTDTGHEGGSASFALGHPEKLVDFGYRSVHDMTVAAKTVISQFYGNAPRFSYWNGCSAGGRQGLKEAQRFPTDFDGIIAGAPASDWTGRAAQSLRVSQAVHKEEDSYIPPAKYPIIRNAVLQACDMLDGVKDGVLEDPTRCKFDPGVLACKGADDASCLNS